MRVTLGVPGASGELPRTTTAPLSPRVAAVTRRMGRTIFSGKYTAFVCYGLRELFGQEWPRFGNQNHPLFDPCSRRFWGHPGGRRRTAASGASPKTFGARRRQLDRRQPRAIHGADRDRFRGGREGPLTDQLHG